jgi:hypothetical protein
VALKFETKQNYLICGKFLVLAVLEINGARKMIALTMVFLSGLEAAPLTIPYYDQRFDATIADMQQ